MRALTVPLAAIIAIPLVACAGVSEAAKGPELAPVSYPAVLAPQAQLPPAGIQPAPAGSANSLWQTGSRSFFRDQRAGHVGDILTVLISIDDSAQTKNTTATSRTAGMKAGVPHFFGLETLLGKVLPGAFDPSAMVDTASSSSNAGTGAVTRAEKINLTIAAVVTGVLPNGNLLIQGTQEVKTNGEVRQLTITGIVRPDDISAASAWLAVQPLPADTRPAPPSNASLPLACGSVAAAEVK